MNGLIVDWGLLSRRFLSNCHLTPMTQKISDLLACLR